MIHSTRFCTFALASSKSCGTRTGPICLNTLADGSSNASSCKTNQLFRFRSAWNHRTERSKMLTSFTDVFSVSWVSNCCRALMAFPRSIAGWRKKQGPKIPWEFKARIELVQMRTPIIPSFDVYLFGSSGTLLLLLQKISEGLYSPSLGLLGIKSIYKKRQNF